VTQITDHLANIRERVEHATRSANRADSVTIVAVSKAQPPAAIEAAYRAGQRHFGESYVQEALPKIRALAELDIVWHFVGRLQTNKTRAVAESFAWVHTLDRDKLAQRLNDQRPHYAAPLNVLIQVKLGGEEQKAGVAESEVAALARAVTSMPRLRLRGLMTLPPQEGDAGRWFRQLAALRERLGGEGLALDTLSMGMSADFEAAIAAGASCVRIGTAIFGARDGAAPGTGA
jgi:pyridoxal phosphate enzyme (YggS family)